MRSISSRTWTAPWLFTATRSDSRSNSRRPGWTEFATGETTLALHPASTQNPAGSTHLGFVATGIDSIHRELVAKGVAFTRPPTPEHGVTLAEFVDSEGARCSLSG